MVITNNEYWDCECETRFIHPKHHEACNECFARRNDQPDSREDELLEINMAPDSKGCKAEDIDI